MRIVTTMWSENNAEWCAATELVDRRTAGLLRHTFRLVRRAAGADAVVVVGAIGAREKYIDQIGAIAVRFLARPRPAVVVTDATWEVGSRAISERWPRLARLVPKLARSVVSLMDHPDVVYCVLSSRELELFPQTWGIEPERVVFTPWFTTASAEPGRIRPGSYLFAGGDSLRDYQTLLDAVRGLPIDARIVSHRRLQDVPSNVVIGPASHQEFVDLMAGCAFAVVPMVSTVRSAGQQTYLNSMAMGKLTIVTDVPGVRDYIDSGVTGLIVDGNAAALREAIEWVIDPANRTEIERIADRGRTAAAHFSAERYFSQVVDIARAAGSQVAKARG